MKKSSIFLYTANLFKKSVFCLSLVLIVFQGTALAQEPVWDGNTVELESTQLASGVFAVIPTGASEMAPKGIPVATTGGFVIGDESVLVVESMLNERLATMMIELIRAETDKPIRYLVNTSFHGDHSYGNYMFGNDVTVIQHESVKSYVENYIEQDKAFMIQNFGAGRGIEEALPRTGDILVAAGGEIKLDLGNVVVTIMDLGFAQTGGDLFIWLEESEVLWTGNPIVAQKPALPWLLDGHLVETHETLQRLYDRISDTTQIVPGHGPVIGREALRWHIDYLAEIKVQVAQAIESGLSLEQTVEKVQMPEYQGYALFGWVHPQLNVPAAYKDLSGS